METLTRSIYFLSRIRSTCDNGYGDDDEGAKHTGDPHSLSWPVKQLTPFMLLNTSIAIPVSKEFILCLYMG